MHVRLRPVLIIGHALYAVAVDVPDHVVEGLTGERAARHAAGRIIIDAASARLTRRFPMSAGLHLRDFRLNHDAVDDLRPCSAEMGDRLVLGIALTDFS